MQSDYLDTKPIKDYFCIYPNKKGIKSNGQWLFKPDQLSYSNIASHFLGLAIYSYFITNTTNILGIEIDLHEPYLSEDLKIIDRFNKYQFITNVFGEPSLIFQSSNNKGLHLYYKFDQNVLFSIIKDQILEKLKLSEKDLKNNYGIEILPTPNKSLKLPYAIREGGALLDSKLKFLFYTSDQSKNAIDYILQSKVYNYYDLFDGIPKQQADFFLKAHTKKQQYKNYKLSNRLAKYESEIIPDIKQGNTNDSILKLAFNCYANGLNIQQAIYRIDQILDQSDINRDKDTQLKRLSERITACYKHYSKNNNHTKIKYKDTINDLFQDSIINNAVDKLSIYMCPHLQNKQPKHKNRIINTYKKFITNIYKWSRYIQQMDNETRLTISYSAYDYFYYYTKFKGLIPLPKALLEKWNKRYNEIIRALIDTGIIELKQRYYNPFEAKKYNSGVKGICNYYKVNL